MKGDTVTQAGNMHLLDPALLARARALAQGSRRGLVAELEGLTGLEPRGIMRALAAPFDLPVMETAAMLALTPAFELLPLAAAMSRHLSLIHI